MPRLFGTAGIRGRYLDTVTPELAYRVGLAVASYVGGQGSAVIGHDVRTTSPLLAQMAAAGLMAGGVDALYVGLAPTPVVAYSVPRSRSKAGIVITASHNPPPDNGIKVFSGDGMEYTVSMEENLESLILNGDRVKLHAEWDEVGSLIQAEEYLDDYIRHLTTVMEPRRRGDWMKIAVDCANGAASNVTPKILKHMGVGRIVSFNCHPDGMFPGRPPEPRPDVLKSFISSMENLNLHALLAHDGDADRLALAIPRFGFVKQDLLIALFAMHKLRDKKGVIIVSVDVGIEVEEVVEAMGGKLVRAKLGKLHEKLKEVPAALLAAEPWKLIDPSWGPWVDGIYQAALIAKIAIEERATPLDLLMRLPFYPSARVSVKLARREDRISLYEAVSTRLLSEVAREGATVDTLDGVKVTFEDRTWILVRPSGTEPKIRFYTQATRRDRLEEIVSTMKGLILDEARKLGVQVLGVEEQVDVGFSLQRISAPHTS